MLSHSALYTEVSLSGAASDKVAALEKAGALVTESPAQIGPTMLKVRPRAHITCW